MCKHKSLLVCCVSMMMGSLSAQTDNANTNPLLTSPIMEERVSELMADRIGIKKDMALKELIDINERAALISRESLMFPADELYNSHWENKYVNPFRNGGITYPDSFNIDCSSFVLPIDREIKVTSKYGPRRRRMHRGIDLKVYVGDTIRAAFDGKIRIRSFERRGYGNYLVVRHPNGLETVYGHLSKFLVSEDQIVRAGEPIGLGGNTGRSTGSHLHFETRFLGIDLDPAELIDFINGVPHQDYFVFRNLKINGKKSNIYTSSADGQMAYHRVRSGDTLGAIARRYGTTVTQLCRLNGIKSTAVLRVGQSLRVSVNGKSQSAASSTTTAASKQTTVKASAAAVASLEEKTTISTQASSEPVYHKIQSGDTLGAIAKKYGTTVQNLCQLNGIKSTTILRLGRSIRCQ